jgi:hypothetical protein
MKEGKIIPKKQILHIQPTQKIIQEPQQPQLWRGTKKEWKNNTSPHPKFQPTMQQQPKVV